MDVVYILNGPNLNFLGKRNPALYGSCTLHELIKEIKELFKDYIEIHEMQTNFSGEMIDKIQSLSLNPKVNGLIVNMGAWSHYDHAIADALRDYKHIRKTPIIEVHLSNIYAREDFRANSLISQISDVVISGLNEKTYINAIFAFLCFRGNLEFHRLLKSFN